MIYSHSQPQQFGDCLIAVVSQHLARGQRSGSNIFVLGQKQPLYVLVRQGGTITAIDMRGRKIPAGRVANVCPQAIEMLRNV